MFEDDLTGAGSAVAFGDDGETAGAVGDTPFVEVKDVFTLDWRVEVGETEAAEVVETTDDGVLAPGVEEGVPVGVVEGTVMVMGIAIVLTVVRRVTGRAVPGL